MPPPLVLVVLVAGGCGGPALTGALSSQLAPLVPTERLPRAFGLDSLTYNGAGIAGPAVAAILAAASSASAATAALALAAAVGALVIAFLPANTATSSRQGSKLDLLAGTRALARDRVLAAVTVATSVGQVGIGALSVVVVVVTARAGKPGAAGWLLTAMAGGALVGSLAWTMWPAAPSRAPPL